MSRQPAGQPDPAFVRKLYVENRYTIGQIAAMLSIGRSRVRTALKAGGVVWRTNRKPCPVDADSLRAMVTEGTGRPGALARRYGVGRNTAARWLADAGLLEADPAINEADLRELYVNKQLNTREVAAKLGADKSRILRALVVAGIPARPREVKRPRANIAADEPARPNSP